MERCPNCGAATRPGAKFCTTCGFRLTDESASPATDPTGDATPTGDPIPGDDAIPSGGATDRVDNPWAAPIRLAPAASAPPPANEPLPEADVAADDGPIPAATDDPTPSPAAATDGLVAERDDPPPAAPGDALPVDATESDDQILSSSWPTPAAETWSSGWGASVDAIADDAPREASITDESPSDESPTTTSDPESDPADTDQAPSPWSRSVLDNDPEPAADPLALAPDAGATLPPATPLADAPNGSNPDAPTGSNPDNDPIDSATDAEAPWLADVQRDPPAIPAADLTDETEPAAPSGTRADDPAARAASLVEELRALLPALIAAPPVDLAAVAADLAAAVPTDPAAAAADRDLLRAALRAAADRPRDIDPMLALTTRADALLVLLDAHDALLAAVARSLAALRPDAPA